MKLHKIETAPIGEEVLLYWKSLNHFEDGRVYNDGFENDAGLYHVLFDGYSLNVMPTHWAYKPEFVEVE